MEVDGRIREIEGDREIVKVVPRNLGENDGIDQERNQGEVMGNNDLNEKIVLDSKRKRVEIELQGENSGQDNMQTDGLKTDGGPKNLNVAGAGLQARLTL